MSFSTADKTVNEGQCFLTSLPDQMPFKILLIFSQRENMTFCISVLIKIIWVQQFHCLNRTSQFTTWRACFKSQSGLLGKTFRARATHTWVPHSAPYEAVLSESSAAQCVCSVLKLRNSVLSG